jgi:hypothetical protein
MNERIRKFKAFPDLQSSEKLDDSNTAKFYLTDMNKKHTYHLWIERGAERFKIFIPEPGVQLTGSRNDMTSSGRLRDYDPGFVQSWIARCFDRLDRNLMEGNYESDSDLDTERFKYEPLRSHDGAVYRMAFDRKENVVSIVFPERELKFKPEEIYLAAPELPIIHAGTINEMVRERLLEEGVVLPPTPYLGGVEATKKHSN